MFFDPAETMRPAPFSHSPYKSLIVPRPIGWISTVSSEGVVNLAPFSYFNGVADDPPCVMFCPNGTHREGGSKDTLANIAETGEFVFNMVGYELKDQMNLSSGNLPRSVDELAAAGLTATASETVKPPRVGEAPAAFECKHLTTITLPTGPKGTQNNVVIGQVTGIHVRDDVINEEGLVDIRKIKPLARLGYMDYAVVEDFFTMLRPE